ncbi:Toxin HigB / Protein kinase domain of HipA [hydrothermal vent metagenome]|uniref:Toxin HigB / Protein kinase domain of HipA n=1 Tax=hydrothermal vent metagenome TaxID=652676 RepID=A0A3B0ZBW2_9ZZZZ
MIDPDALNVWFEDRLVGHLWRNPVGAIGFRYESNWISAGGFTISRTLPLTTEDFLAEDSVAHRFFANLLPEGGVRDHVVRDLKISNTDFDLLRAIGGECAGAISLLSVEREPSKDRSYRLLPDEELARLIARRGQIYAAWPKDKRPRLSLAGAQDKCPVLNRDGNTFLPECEAPSSHILKFELADYRHLPAYETFTSHLARQIGLPVVDIELHSIEKYFYAQIERYDRVWDERGEVQRLHQEDFCQALGYGHEKKYQDSGGPTFADCYRLVQDASTDPAIDTQNLLRWQIFNVLAGNSDGHAKNLSLLYLQNGGVRLAPFYDLVCTRAIERIDYHLAFDVGGQRDPGGITTKHWDTLARQCDVGPRFLNRLLQETTASLLEQIGKTKALFEAQYGDYPSLQRIEHVVTQQCNRATRT